MVTIALKLGRVCWHYWVAKHRWRNGQHWTKEQQAMHNLRTGTGVGYFCTSVTCFLVHEVVVWTELLSYLDGYDFTHSWSIKQEDILLLPVFYFYRHHQKTTKSSHSVSKAKSVERSQGILHLATLTTQDRNWDLEIRRTLTTRQLYPYHNHGGWQWDEAEVVMSDVGGCQWWW